MTNSNKILNLLILLIISNIILLSINSNHWGYDEFGAVSSHLELSNSIFKDEYKAYLKNIGIGNEYIIEIIIDYFLPIIIVPLRWTYAIGISPWLGISNYINIDWPYLRPILMAPYVFLIYIGLILIKKTLIEIINPVAITVFFILIFGSSPFLYWTNTLTSYSHHIFVFGIILYSVLKCDFNGHIFNKKSILLAIVPLFNYQYIFIICALGFYDSLKYNNPKKFLSIFKSWFLPAITCFLSVIFLLIRSRISGKHQDPAFASLNQLEVNLYSIPSNFSFSIDFFDYITSIYINILFSFYKNNIIFTNYSTFYCALFFTLIIFVIYINWNTNKKLTSILTLIIGATLFLQFLGLMHVAPKRHQLVLFLPAILLFSIWLSNFLLKYIVIYRINYILYVMIFLFLAYKINTFSFAENNFPKDYIKPYLDKEDVERLVLNQCDYEPILYKDIRVAFNPIYRCGPRVIEKLPPNLNTIAVWSSFPINANGALDIIGDYSDSKWSLSSPLQLDFNQDCSSCSRLWIAKLILENK
jgi:hypothetical protein